MYFLLSVLPESFSRQQEYGLTLLVSTDDKVKAFLKDVLAQIQVTMARFFFLNLL